MLFLSRQERDRSQELELQRERERERELEREREREMEREREREIEREREREMEMKRELPGAMSPPNKRPKSEEEDNKLESMPHTKMSISSKGKPSEDTAISVQNGVALSITLASSYC